MAVERFVTVCLPFQHCNMSNGLGYILPIVAFSILYNVVKFFEIETVYIEAEEWVLDQNGTNTSVVVTYPWLSPTELRKDPEYSKYVVFILNFIIMGEFSFHFILKLTKSDRGLMPVLLLACLNLLIYRSISANTIIHNSISSAHR